MKKHLLLFSLLLLTPGALFGDPLEAHVFLSQRVIQDPKTKVIYYLESDLRHIAALSPDGKLLWCCEVFPVPKVTYRQPPFIDRINWDGDDISVAVWTGKSGGYGKIDKQTGVYSRPTITE